MTDPEQKATDDEVGKHFVRWRDEAGQLARALLAARYLGPVLVDPHAADHIARKLMNAEPPGTAAQQVAAGYRAGLEDGKNGRGSTDPTRTAEDNRAVLDAACTLSPADPKDHRVAVALRLAAAAPAIRAEIERMRAALNRLARLGNEPTLGNSAGNMIAREALGL